MPRLVVITVQVRRVMRAHRAMHVCFPSLVCMTTPCPTAGWPPVTWKGSGAHVPLSVQAKPLEPLLAATPRLGFRPAYRKSIE
ncbi:unnamed protein product [Spirodela intermedia]|uniref:Secreted protein n=1 Tax=Spirodela intermedia TaxID=51605 RepID=A0ABN7E7X8_SPIIN|nr:unnamed protein product [Spirodela intermedia]